MDGEREGKEEGTVKRIRTRVPFFHFGSENIKRMSSVDCKIDGNRYPRQMISNELSRCSEFNFTKTANCHQHKDPIYNVFLRNHAQTLSFAINSVACTLQIAISP